MVAGRARAISSGAKHAQQDYNEIIAVLERYCDGLYRGDTSVLKTAFHPQARYITASDGALLHLDMAAYFPIVEARPSPESRGEPYRFAIDSIELAGPVTAFARMRCTMLAREYVDLLTLIQIDGEWRIIAKVFHFDPVDPAHA